MFRSLLITSALLLTLTSAHALGLGDIALDSRLNQPLQAKIPIVLDGESTIEDLSIKLADQARFEQAGIKRSALALSLRFATSQGEEGAFILVTTKERVLEPMIQFILEVEQNGVRTMREYTAMIEAPINQ